MGTVQSVAGPANFGVAFLVAVRRCPCFKQTGKGHREASRQSWGKQCDNTRCPKERRYGFHEQDWDNERVYSFAWGALGADRETQCDRSGFPTRGARKH